MLMIPLSTNSHDDVIISDNTITTTSIILVKIVLGLEH